MLVESAADRCWEGVGSTRPLKFATKGGARNHIKKLGLVGATIVKVVETKEVI